MRFSRLLLAFCFLFIILSLFSCGPFGAGPWYAIYDSTKKDEDEDEVGAVSIVYGPMVAELTNSTAKIEWNTDLQANSTVQYGLDTGYGMEESDAALDTIHSVTITGLTCNTTYHCRVVSRAGTGAVGVSGDLVFTTKVGLTITSAYGPTTPGTGTLYFDSGENVLAYAPESVDGPAKTRYRCAGWTGSGSVSASGSDASTSFAITEDSTLTWNWVTQYYISISTNPIGAGTIVCSPLGNWHDEGSTPEITATGNAGYSFMNWTGDLTGSVNPDTLTIDAPKTVVANFSGETLQLTVNSAFGSPDPPVGVHICASGADIVASVDSPVSGGAGIRYDCTGWTGTGDVDPSGTTNSTNFTITQDSSITWTWVTQYQLTTTVNPVGGGTVSRNPDATWYDANTLVDLAASESGGFTFNNWTGDPVTNPDAPSTPETVEILMDSAKSVTANFTGGGTFWTLTVNSAYGTPDPPTSTVADGTLVDASVDSPVAGPAGTRYVCTGWNGTGSVVPPSGSTNSVSFTITQDSTLTWNWKTQYQLTTLITPVGGGSIGRSPNATWYDDTTVVQLTANPSASYVFDSWSGDLTGSTNPDNITMNGPKSVTATFITTTYTLTVASTYGSPDPPVGDNTYTSGASVNASVDSPVSGGAGIRYVCTGWDGTGSVSPSSGSTNSVSFTITQNSTLTWNWKTEYELATAMSPPAAGTVQLTPPGGWYDPSTSVEVLAVVDSSYSFTSWSVDLSGGTNPENLTMDGPKSVTAHCELLSNVIRVPDDYGTIQEAIDACSAGGTVLVANGTYTGTGNKDLDFNGKAITVKSESGAAGCTIDCQNSGRGFNFHANESSSSVVQGFTIKNGVAGDGKGGGIKCYNSDPTISNCIIMNCTASSSGGGIFCDHADPVITGCSIKNNSANYGGGIHALYCISVISNCAITGNTAQNYGGGVDCYIATGKPTLVNCVITGNSVTSTSSGYGGGGICARYNAAPTLKSCLIAANTSGYYGGGVYLHDGAGCTLTNCTIATNTAYRGGGLVTNADSSATLRNSIVWANNATVTRQMSINAGVASTAYYCDFKTGTGEVSGTVNESDCIHSDPRFASTSGMNFRLLPRSVCLNAGSNTYVDAGDKDLDGRDRILDATVDMGAYELGALAVPSAYATIQAAIDAAQDGDTIAIADGTYAGTGNRDLDFQGKLIVVCSENGPASCIIDCQDLGRGFYFHSNEDLGSVVADITVINGDVGTDRGGAVYCSDSSPTIRGCILSANSARRGGAVACRYDCSALLDGCTLQNNWGLYGGGIICESSASPTIQDCTITGNTGDNNGGGIYSDGSDPELLNSLVIGNTALSPGSGGGIYFLNGSTAILRNCTIADNQGAYGGGIASQDSGTSISLVDSILWGNSASSSGNQLRASSSSIIYLNYCDYANGGGDVVESTGGVVSPTVCIYDDPLFVIGPRGEYYLSQIAADQAINSPCMDAGSGSAASVGLNAKTTRTDGVTDASTVDLGYHYEP